MNHLHKYINLNQLNKTTDEKSLEENIHPLAIKVVDFVFTKFFLLCRGFDALFHDKKRFSAEKACWCLAFSKRNIISVDQVKPGLQKLETYSYPNPPQLGEFLRWCELSSEYLNLIPKEQAFKKAIEINRQFSEKPKDLSELQLYIIKNAIKETGSFEMRTKPEKEIRALFERNYELAIQNHIKEGPFNSNKKEIDLKYSNTNNIIDEKKYNHVKGYNEARIEIEEILGIKLNGFANKQRMLENNSEISGKEEYTPYLD